MAERENNDRAAAANQYSVYVNRDTQATQVNWGQIAKDLTTGANAIRDGREAKKQAITDATSKAMNDLAQIADVDNQSLGKLLINGSDFSKKTLMANMELLRNGGLDPKDYQLIMQSQLDGYKNLSLYAEGADAKYQEAMTRLELGEDGQSIASDLEMTWNEGTFGFGNLRNKRLITNPRNGELVLVTMQDDGTGNLVMPDPDTNPEFFQNTAYLNVATDFKLDRRNTNTLADGITENLADVILSTSQEYNLYSGGGQVTSIQDFRNLFDAETPDGKGYMELKNDDGSKMTYEEFMSDQIDSITGDKSDLSSMNAMQVLTGAGYKMVQSEAEAKKKGISKYIIYKNVNGRPEIELTKEQMTEARNIAKRAIESRIDLKIKQTQEMAGREARAESPYEGEKGKINRKRSAYIKDINKVLTNPDIASSEATMRTLVTNINEQRTDAGRPRINDIDINDDTIIITYESGEPTVIKRRIRDENDMDTITNETSVKEDIGALYQILVPGAQSEGGDLALSPSEIDDFIIKEKIAVGERGVNRNVGYTQDIQKPEVLGDETAVATPTGSQTSRNYWTGDGAPGKTELGPNIGNAFSDDDDQIAEVSNKFIEAFTTQAASDARTRAGISEVRTVVTGDGSGRKSVIKFKENGVEKEIVVMAAGDMNNGVETRKYGQQVQRALNELNELAYKNRGKVKNKIKMSYPAFKADFLAANPGATTAQITAAFNAQ